MITLTQVDGTSLEEAFTSDVTLEDWIVAVVVVVASFLLGLLLRKALVGLLQRGAARAGFAEVLVGRILQWGIFLIGLTYGLTALGVRIGPLLGALGIGGVALALALQPMLQNLFAGVVLHAQRPIRPGDEIETGDVRGRVIQITSRSVVVQSFDGRTVFIPNTVVLDRAIVNVVRTGRRRTTVQVGVAYGTDLDRAAEVIRRAVATVGGVRPNPAPLVLVHGFADSAVTIDVDVWHAPDEATMRRVRGGVVTAVHRALADDGITIPFPQRTVWFGAETTAGVPDDHGAHPEVAGEVEPGEPGAGDGAGAPEDAPAPS